MSATQRWRLRRRELPEAVTHMGTALGQLATAMPSSGVDPALLQDAILAKVLCARKIDPAQLPVFLMRRQELADPFQLAGMSRAVSRLRHAIHAGEPIVVYGDFDVDGVSATVLLVSALKALGGHVSAYIPDRFSEAYGLNKPALQRLHHNGARVIVTVDCGSRSIDEVKYAQELGLDIIITDHHSVGEQLPPAVAVINPKQRECHYPFKGLAGVGVAYRLAEALFRVARRMGKEGTDDLHVESLLDLVSLGTVADMVPLVEENRTLAIRGLELLRSCPRSGLAALMEAAGLQQNVADSIDISFRLAPRLNAAGRLKSAQLSYDLLMTANPEQSQELANELNAINEQRQKLLDEQVALAQGLLGEVREQQILLVAGEEFHEGIVGLVASRLVEEHHRPALVMRRGPETTRGSARSIEGFHITRAFDSCAHLFLRYGGHERAAGFTLASSNLEALYQRLEEYCSVHLGKDLLSPYHRVDAIVSLSEIQETTPQALSLMEPFGEGNPQPALATCGLRIMSLRTVGDAGKHLQLDVTDGTRFVPAIAFRHGHLAGELRRDQIVDIIYRPTIHEWRNERTLQLVVEAVRPSSGNVTA